MAAEEEHVENEDFPPQKRRKVGSSVLDNFAKIGNPHEKIRLKSAIDLIRHVSSNQNETENESKYALGRLVRGLGASKIPTRIGYYSTLVGLLNVETINLGEILEIVKKELHKSGSSTKSEEADVSSGQILVAGAILRSDLYKTLSGNEKSQVLDLLISAGKGRDYLLLASYSFIVDLYSKIDRDEFEKVVFPKIKPEVSKSWKEQTLDSLYLLLETQKVYEDVFKPKFLKNSLGTLQIICKESLYDICNILTSLPRLSNLRHPIFKTITQVLAKSDLLQDFCEILDKTLTRPTRNRYFAITTIFIGIFEEIQDPNSIPDLLTSSFIQQTVTNFKMKVGKLKDPEFQKLVSKLFTNLLDQLKKDETKTKTKLKVLKKLLFYPGTFIFEKVTKTKLVQNITQLLNQDGVKKLADIYKEVILARKDRIVGENKTEKWWNSDRIYAAHLLIKLINNPKISEENEWKIQQIEFLLKLGLFKDSDELIGQELADSFRDAFFSSLDLKLSKLENLRLILSKIVQNLNSAIKSDPDLLRESLTADHLEIWERTVEMSSKLENKKKNQVFHTLFLHLGLQLFNNNRKLASDSLEELFVCYDRIKKNRKSDQSNNDPEWIEVVTDLFLNLLSHNSHLLRNVINCVFPHLCQNMTATSLHQILTVLDPKNEDNPLSKNEDSDGSSSDEDDDDSDSHSDSSDAEEDGEDTVNDRLRLALHKVLTDQDVDNSDVDSLDLDELDEESGEKLDEALAKAFKTFKPNSGKSKKQSKDAETLTHFRIRVLDLIDIYLGSNPSLYLTLEVMLPLLQTLEFCIRDDHQKPLLDRVKSTLKKLSTLRKFENVENVDQGLLEGLLRSLLDKGTKNSILIQDMGEKMAECCGFIINSSQLLPSDESKNSKSVVGVLKNHLEIFFEKRDCLTPYVLFKNAVQMNWGGVFDLIPTLLEVVYNDKVRPFRRNQALELLRLFYQNHRLLTGFKDDLNDLIGGCQSEFLQSSVIFFTDFCNNPGENKIAIREKFLGNLFATLAAIKNSPTCEWSDWDSLGEIVREFRSNLTFSKDTKMAFSKLCKSLKISHVVAMKSSPFKLSGLNNLKGNDDDEEVTVEENGKNKKKRKNNKSALKEKKESKELRLQSLSEGFEKAKKRKLSSEKVDDEEMLEM